MMLHRHFEVERKKNEKKESKKEEFVSEIFPPEVKEETVTKPRTRKKADA